MKKYRLHGLGLCLALTLLSTASLVPTSQAQQVSPAGTWDLIISGAEKGVAYITFDDAGSLSGYEAIAPSKPDSVDDPIEIERISGDQGRVITTTSGSSTNTIRTILGFGLLSGTWSYDIKGNIIGVYTEGSANRSCTTNDEITAVVSNAIIDFKTNVVTITVTNYFTNQVVNCVTNPITNGVSFTGIVRADRIVLKARSSTGKMTLKGVPAEDAPDISGSYYAKVKKQGVQFTEFLTLVPTDNPDVLLNGYDVFGQGPGYEFVGIALLSNQKKLGLVTVGSAENSPLSAGFGGVNTTRGRASLNTVDLDGARGSYNLFKIPDAP